MASPATPEGRPEVFPTQVIRIDHLRLHGGGYVPDTLKTPTVGTLSPDDGDALCLSLP